MKKEEQNLPIRISPQPFYKSKDEIIDIIHEGFMHDMKNNNPDAFNFVLMQLGYVQSFVTPENQYTFTFEEFLLSFYKKMNMKETPDLKEKIESYLKEFKSRTSRSPSNSNGCLGVFLFLIIFTGILFIQ